MIRTRVLVLAPAAAAIVTAGAQAVAAGREDMMREVLRQQSAAERGICTAVQQTIAGGAPARDAARAAIALGHGSCQVIRCAVAGGADPAQVLQGAADAGADPAVMSRCAVEGGAPAAAVAAFLATLTLEPNYCYLGPQVGAPPAVGPTLPGQGLGRGYRRPPISPYAF